MKQIISLVLLLISTYAHAASCSASKSGDWEKATTWSCGHVPTTGDNVTIGTGITVTVKGNNTDEIGNLSISGTLDFTNGAKVSLGANSSVNIYTGGSITGGNPGAKLVFPSNTIKGSFSLTGPYHINNGGQGTGTVILPLTLLSFTTSLQQNQEVVLSWKTANEVSIYSFELESSDNGSSDWKLVETISPMASEGGGYSYAFRDRNKLSGDRYYRLKIVDVDGKYIFSKVVAVTSGQAETFSINPTLVGSSMTVSLPASGAGQVSILNTFGQVIKTFASNNQTFTIDVSMLTHGLYFIKLDQGKNSYTTRFFKQ